MRKGSAAVVQELQRRGWTVREITDGRLHLLEAEKDERRVHIRPKSKTRGTWQATASSGVEHPVPRPVPTFWAFVDLGASPPIFFIAPDDWVRQDIYHAHDAYLRQHGGHRAENDASDHHSISALRITHWLDRWDIIERLGVPTHDS